MQWKKNKTDHFFTWYIVIGCIWPSTEIIVEVFFAASFVVFNSKKSRNNCKLQFYFLNMSQELYKWKNITKERYLKIYYCI